MSKIYIFERYYRQNLFILPISKEFLNPQILIKQLLGINLRKTV